MLILAPVVCMLSAIGSEYIISTTLTHMQRYFKAGAESAPATSGRLFSSACVLLFTVISLLLFGWHSSYIASVAYSSPNVILDAGIVRSLLVMLC